VLAPPSVIFRVHLVAHLIAHSRMVQIFLELLSEYEHVRAYLSVLLGIR
jgi:hypothetical protein